MSKSPPKVFKAVPICFLTSGLNQFLSSGPEDCEPSVDLEDSGKGGVEVESEYDLELGIGDNVDRSGTGHLSLLTIPNKIVRW